MVHLHAICEGWSSGQSVPLTGAPRAETSQIGSGQRLVGAVVGRQPPPAGPPPAGSARSVAAARHDPAGPGVPTRDADDLHPRRGHHGGHRRLRRDRRRHGVPRLPIRTGGTTMSRAELPPTCPGAGSPATVRPPQAGCRLAADDSSALVWLSGVLEPAEHDRVRDALLARLGERPGPIVVDLAGLRIPTGPPSAGSAEVRRAVRDWPAADLLVVDPAGGGHRGRRGVGGLPSTRTTRRPRWPVRRWRRC